MPSAIFDIVLSPPLPAASALKVASMPVTVPRRPTSGAALTAIFISFRSLTKGSISRARISSKASCTVARPPSTTSSTWSKSSPIGPSRSFDSTIQSRHSASVIRPKRFERRRRDTPTPIAKMNSEMNARAIIAQPPFNQISTPFSARSPRAAEST